MGERVRCLRLVQVRQPGGPAADRLPRGRHRRGVRRAVGAQVAGLRGAVLHRQFFIDNSSFQKSGAKGRSKAHRLNDLLRELADTMHGEMDNRLSSSSWRTVSAGVGSVSSAPTTRAAAASWPELHGLRAAGYNKVKTGLGGDMAQAHGGWASRAHEAALCSLLSCRCRSHPRGDRGSRRRRERATCPDERGCGARGGAAGAAAAAWRLE